MSLCEANAFKPAEEAGWTDRRDPRLHALKLTLGANGELAIRLDRPSRYLLRSRWPSALPSPLLVMQPGRITRITWNGRFAASMAGSNRSFYYAEHVFLVASVEAPAEDLFLATPPHHDIDLRTRIY